MTVKFSALCTPPVADPLGIGLPYMEFSENFNDNIPDEADCRALWREYDMFPNICEHSKRVAELALALAERALSLGRRDVRDITLSSGLLHDIAKTYTVRYGGSHAQLGASWIMSRVGNPLIAQAIMHHVWWPWDFPDDLANPVFLVLYADKRVMHDNVVSLKERFTDLLARYGKTKAARLAVMEGNNLAQKLEHALSAFLELPLDAYTLSGGRLVKRA